MMPSLGIPQKRFRGALVLDATTATYEYIRLPRRRPDLLCRSRVEQRYQWLLANGDHFQEGEGGGHLFVYRGWDARRPIQPRLLAYVARKKTERTPKPSGRCFTSEPRLRRGGVEQQRDGRAFFPPVSRTRAINATRTKTKRKQKGSDGRKEDPSSREPSANGVEATPPPKVGRTLPR